MVQDSTPASIAVTRTAARFLALWMAYEDVIRVADLKTRPSRFARIRREMGARPDEPMTVREFLKPGVDEVAALLPAGLAARLREWGRRHGRTALSEGLQVATTSAGGFVALRTLAALRPLRRRGARFVEEQALVERWLAALLAVLGHRTPAARALALEIAECPRLLKGYGETHARGRRSFLGILETLVAPPGEHPDDRSTDSDFAARANAIRRARDAALADPEGRALAEALGRAPPPVRAQPVRWVERRRP